MSITFSEAVTRLSSLENRGWRLGLDRMTEFVRRLGLQDYLQQGGQFIHIAGTNGKGSVTAFVQSILREQGYLTGACYSPFVYTVRERIQLSRQQGSPLISPEAFAALVEQMWPAAEELDVSDLGGPTEFEFKTAMAFLHWQQAGAECAAVEVGLGGRLDATNVLNPTCSVITSIGFDHTEILGPTLGKIAIEKAGIIKPGRPVVVGDLDDEAWHAIETIAKLNTAPVWKYGREFVLSYGFDGYSVSTQQATYSRLAPGIPGAAQPHNMAVAIAACEAAGLIREPKAVQRGVGKAFAPGRMQRLNHRGVQILLDGAHNAQAAQFLADSLRREGRVVLLTGMLEGHSPGDFYEPLAAVAPEAHFVPINFRRARSPYALERECGFLFSRSFTHDSLEEALTECLSSGADLVVVTGSFYLVGEVGRLLGIA